MKPKRLSNGVKQTAVLGGGVAPVGVGLEVAAADELGVGLVRATGVGWPTQAAANVRPIRPCPTMHRPAFIEALTRVSYVGYERGLSSRNLHQAEPPFGSAIRSWLSRPPAQDQEGDHSADQADEQRYDYMAPGVEHTRRQ
jgi:hypothetical protein